MKSQVSPHVFMSLMCSPPSEREVGRNPSRYALAGRAALAVGFGLLVSLPAAPLHATVYKWTDSSGQVHYTDQWQKGAQPVDLPEPSVYTPAPLPGAKQPAATEADASGPVGEGDYDLLEVSAPAPDETIRSNEGKVSVSLRLEPTLRQGDVIELFVDGEKRGELGTTGGTLSGVNRGSHSIQVRVVDASGRELISSQPVTFYLRRESKLFPQRQTPTPLPSGSP